MDNYENYLASLRGRLTGSTEHLFTTDATGLFEAYLEAIPAEHRQHFSCNACRHFVNRYGGLVMICSDGSIVPAMWDASAGAPIKAMFDIVMRAKVTDVFSTDETVLGKPVTGEWKHLAVTPPAMAINVSATQTAGQLRAAKREDFKNVMRALDDFTLAHIDTALALLDSNSLYRGEKLLGAAKWLRERKQESAVMFNVSKNLLWRAIASAPEGFCHPRTSMIGTLLEDIAAGMDYKRVSERFADKMDPAKYQRAQAAPRVGQIEAAERAVAALGIAPAFARRYATFADIPDSGILWAPLTQEIREMPVQAASPDSVFGHLKPADATLPEMDIPPRLITWEKFANDVLPGARKIEYRTPLVGRFCALTAAADIGAPSILQWDAPDARNTVSWAFPNPAARAADWNLQPGTLVRVHAIVSQPNQWGGDSAFAQHGKGAFLLLEGARDTRGLPGGGLFTEHLRSDLKPYRSTIEAHMNKLVVQGADDPATIGFGIGLLAGNDWTEMAAPLATSAPTPGSAPKRIHALLVVDDSGSMGSYIGAARSAVRSLLDALRGMPGEVDVTFTLFGSDLKRIATGAPLQEAIGFERHMAARLGNTALNDAIGDAITTGMGMQDANYHDTAFFLGIVTDGEENHSRIYRSTEQVRTIVMAAQNTGRWTIAYAGAGMNPAWYAQNIGIPEGNVKVFRASAEGFAEAGAAYASSATAMAGAYSRGVRSSNSFFSAASGREAIGTDHPVLVVTAKSGAKLAYKLDRWE